jgi:hypothetical protein
LWYLGGLQSVGSWLWHDGLEPYLGTDTVLDVLGVYVGAVGRAWRLCLEVLVWEGKGRDK